TGIGFFGGSLTGTVLFDLRHVPNGDRLNRDGDCPVDRFGENVDSAAHTGPKRYARCGGQGDFVGSHGSSSKGTAFTNVVGFENADLHREVGHLFLRSGAHDARRVGDLGHVTLKDPFGVGVDLDRGRIADRYVDHVVLVDVDLDLHEVELGDPHHFRTGHLAGADHAFAQLHVELADRARHRRVDARLAELLLNLAQAGLGACDGILGAAVSRFGDFVLRLGGQEITFRNHAAIVEILLTVELEFGVEQIRLPLF